MIAEALIVTGGLCAYHFLYHEVFLKRGKLDKRMIPSGDGFLNPDLVETIHHEMRFGGSDAGNHYHARMISGREIKLDPWQHAYLMYGWKETPPPWERDQVWRNRWRRFLRSSKRFKIRFPRISGWTEGGPRA